MKLNGVSSYFTSILGLFMAFLLLVACDKEESDEVETPACDDPGIQYYSDYLVFIADDGGDRLVVPIDFNWSPNEAGYSEEFKSWRGTDDEWPIAYYLNEVQSKVCEIPQEALNHNPNDNFQFNETERLITAKVNDSIELKFSFPNSDEWVRMGPEENGKALYAFRTNLMDGSIQRSGWAVYERIRRLASAGNRSDFATFYWIPIVVDGDLYYFQDHKGQQSIARWLNNNGTINTEMLTGFELKVLERGSDSKSGRNNIPEVLQIVAPEWNLDIILKSTGSQVGHGDPFPNGLAYYRQSLLEPLDSSISKGYGMLELILEDD